MKNSILLQSRGKVTKNKLGLFLFLFTLLISTNTALALPVCSFVANTLENISVNENCEAEISPDAILEDPTLTCPGGILTVYIYDGNIEIASGNPAIIPTGYVGKTLTGKVHDSFSDNWSDACILNIQDNIKPTLECFAEIDENVYTLGASAPTHHRRGDYDVTCTAATNPAAFNVRYMTIPLYVDTDGTFDLWGSLSSDWSSYHLALYENAYDPLFPCANYVEPTGVTVMSDREYALEAGKNYVMVVSARYDYITADLNVMYELIPPPVPPYAKAFTKVPNCEYDIFCFENIQDRVFLRTIDNCDANAVVDFTELITDNDCLGALTPDILRVINRDYWVTDASNNVSTILPVTINVKKMVGSIPPASFNVLGPLNLTVTNGSAIECDALFTPDLFGNPHPSFSGAPVLDVGGQLYPLDTPFSDCNISATYFDLPGGTPTPGCVEVIERYWTVNEWSCANSSLPIAFFLQVIEIADTQAPTFTCPVPVNLTTNVNAGNNTACGANFSFPFPVSLTDNCNASTLVWTINVYDKDLIPIGSQSIDMSTLFVVDDMVLPVGANTVEYIVADICGNSHSCQFMVTVEDKTAPVAICQTFTTVSLTHDGEAEVPAPSFDSGTWDDCGVIDRIVARRDDAVDKTAYFPFLTFTCADIGNLNLKVWMRAYDDNNNWDECLVNVEVQDMLNPTIQAPADEIVDCEYYYDPLNLIASFGWATAYDNCGYKITQDSTTTLYACYGELVDGHANVVKRITRAFTATDDGGRTAVDTQNVYFVRQNFFGYVGSSTTLNANNAITWPVDTTYTTCQEAPTPADYPLPPNNPFHPSITGSPIYAQLSCDGLMRNYTDELFLANSNNFATPQNCFIILRTWTIMDMCHKPTGTSFASWEYVQTINVNNSVAPTISATPADTTAYTLDTLCLSGHINLVYAAEDDCTTHDNLLWTYFIDYDMDDGNDIANWDVNNLLVKGDSILDASGDYPIGSHRLLWRVWDQCGNKTDREMIFRIVNNVTPTPICVKGLATDLGNMGSPLDPLVMVDAEFFDPAKDSRHVCGYDLIYSFSADTLNKTRTFYCPDTAGLVYIEMWVTSVLPDGSLLQDFCKTDLNVQDNMLLCPPVVPLPYATVSGGLTDEYDNAVSGVNIALEGSEFIDELSDEAGEYAFPQMLTGGDYRVKPILDEDHANGVSTLDLIHVQKHLLGLNAISTPYKMIAADVNNDQKVSASDLLNARELILGVTDEFENNTSWRFIQKSYEFQNEANPLTETYPEFEQIDNIQDDVQSDFIAIKVGDITNDASLNGLPVIESRHSRTLNLDMDARAFRSNEMLEIPVYANDFEQINGFQFTLNYDAMAISFEAIESGALNMSATNYYNAGSGIVTVSWSNALATEVDDDEVLFTLLFNANKKGQLNEAIDIVSLLTRAEAYDVNLEKLNVELNFRNLETEGEYALYQNMPNPFSDNTMISFNMKEAGLANITIFDINGKMIRTYHGEFAKGLQELNISKRDLQVEGMLYYQFSTADFTATRKMILIK